MPDRDAEPVGQKSAGPRLRFQTSHSASAPPKAPVRMKEGLRFLERPQGAQVASSGSDIYVDCSLCIADVEHADDLIIREPGVEKVTH